MTKFQRLQKRLEKMYGQAPTDFERTYAGRNLRARGAFVWTAKLGIKTIGSCWTVTELLKAKHLTDQHCGFNEIEIFPE